MSAHLRPWKTCPVTLVLLIGSSLLSFADRPTPPDDAPRVALHGNVNPLANPANDVGRADSSRILHGVSIYFKRTAAQQAGLDALLAQQQDRRSPSYHQWLTPEQFGERFGASAQELQATAAWLQAQGLTIEEISRSRDHLRFSGTVAQVEAALHTQMHRYQVHGELHIANSSEPEVPAAFAGSILGVHLHDFRPHPHSAHRPHPQFTSSISGNTFLVPDDFATIYDLKPLYDAGFTGAGRKIAVVGQTKINLADIHAFRSAAGLPVNDPQPMLVPNSCSGTVVNDQCPDVSTNDIDESNLDLEWAGGVAPNATILYVYAGNLLGAFEALQYAVTNDFAPVISISYGDCEANESSMQLTNLRNWAQQANSQGQTIIAAAGDAGATDCDYTADPNNPIISATHGLAVDVPASVPEVTGIGGTTFLADVNDQSMFWSPINLDAFSGSALSFIVEGVWNDSGSLGLSAGGGGVSNIFPIPVWQTPLGFVDPTHRYVPDVSFTASPGHDGYLICSQSSCINGFRDASQNLDPIGGTSAGVPSFAAALTLMEQAMNSDGLGNINPLIYAAAANQQTYASAFHDTTQGTNLSPCTQGTPDCPNGGSIGYAALFGYDLASGLGSADLFNLYAALSGKRFTSVSITVDNKTPIVGQPVNAIATITPANHGNVTGNLDFYLNGTRLAGPLPVSNNAVSYSIGGFSNGTNTLAAVYFGDTTFAASSSLSNPIILNAQPNSPVVALSAYPTSLTISSLGDAQPSTITATAGGGFSGNVVFACTVTPLAHSAPANPPSCTVFPSSLALSSNTPSATTTLTVTGRELNASLVPHHDLRWLGFSSAAFACSFFLISGDKKRRLASTSVVLLSAALFGCGGGGGGGNGNGQSNTLVPVTPGSYQVTVTGTGNGIPYSVNLVANVQ